MGSRGVGPARHAVVAEGLGTDVDRGLTEVQAAERLERVGRNQPKAAEPVPAWRELAEQFRTSDTPAGKEPRE